MEVDGALRAAIRSAFEAAASGVSQVKILEMIRSSPGFKSRGTIVSRQAVSKMLRNPVYAGRMVVKRWGIDEPGDWEAIVSIALFDKVQKALGNGGRKTGAKSKAACNANVPECV
jgi:hypothetical protein